MCQLKNREEAVTGMERTTEIFSEAAMELHKVHMTGDQTSHNTKVLGMLWDTQTDQMAVEVPDISCPSSKSELLAAVAKPFDPLGLNSLADRRQSTVPAHMAHNAWGRVG